MKIETVKQGIRIIPENQNDCFMLGKFAMCLDKYELSEERKDKKWDINYLFINNEELLCLLLIYLPQKVKGGQ